MGIIHICGAINRNEIQGRPDLGSHYSWCYERGGERRLQCTNRYIKRDSNNMILRCFSCLLSIVLLCTN